MTDTTRRRFLALTSVTAAAGIAGCSGSAREGPTGTPTPPAGTATTTPTDAPATASPDVPTVDMITDNRGSYFDPKGLLVEPGATVRWVNASGAHTTTAYHPDIGGKPLRIPEATEPWDSGTFTEAGAVYEVTLETAGVYDYYCIPHESLAMVGRLVVGGPQGGPGTTEPTDLPPAAREALPSVEAILEQGTVAGP